MADKDNLEENTTTVGTRRWSLTLLTTACCLRNQPSYAATINDAISLTNKEIEAAVNLSLLKNKKIISLCHFQLFPKMNGEKKLRLVKKRSFTSFSKNITQQNLRKPNSFDLYRLIFSLDLVRHDYFVMTHSTWKKKKEIKKI